MLTSGRLAALAGTTVRALRHYHQLGLLPEPERTSGGYREYGVGDLVRVLRIRTLADLGIPLDRMPELLDDRSARAGALLDELDAELAATMARLERQRAALRVIRDNDLAPDVRPELANLMTLLAVAAPPSTAAMERDLTTLVLHLGGDAYLPVLEDLYTTLGSDRLSAGLRAISDRFEALTETQADDPAIVALAADYVRLFAPVLEELRARAASLGDLPPGVEDIVMAFSTEGLGPGQLEVLRLVGEAFPDSPEPSSRILEP